MKMRFHFIIYKKIQSRNKLDNSGKCVGKFITFF